MPVDLSMLPFKGELCGLCLRKRWDLWLSPFGFPRWTQWHILREKTLGHTTCARHVLDLDFPIGKITRLCMPVVVWGCYSVIYEPWQIHRKPFGAFRVVSTEILALLVSKHVCDRSSSPRPCQSVTAEVKVHFNHNKWQWNKTEAAGNRVLLQRRSGDITQLCIVSVAFYRKKMGVCSNRDGCCGGKDTACGKESKQQHIPSEYVVRELENTQGSCQEWGVTGGGMTGSRTQRKNWKEKFRGIWCELRGKRLILLWRVVKNLLYTVKIVDPESDTGSPTVNQNQLSLKIMDF